MPVDTLPKNVYLSLGSNLGDRKVYLNKAVNLIALLPHTRVIASSPIIETAPWGKTDQPAFLNMALHIETMLAPLDLLHATQNIESLLHRERKEHWGPRTIDIDILIYENCEIDTPELHLPHPYLTKRRFVLEPLAEISPGLRVHGKTIHEWLEQLTTT